MGAPINDTSLVNISGEKYVIEEELLETELAELFGGVVECAWGGKMDDMVERACGWR